MTSQIIQKDKLAKKGEYLHIDMQVSFPPFSVKENEYMTLIPLLIGENHKQELPCFLVNGERRHKGYKQMIRSLGKKNVYSIYNIYEAFSGKKNI